MSGKIGYGTRFNYFVLSLSSLFLIFWAKAHSGETNLPPLQPFVRMTVCGLYLNLAFSYFFLTSAAPAKTPMVSWFVLGAVAAGLCAMLPVFSGDLMEYLIRGRMLLLYHLNPYSHYPSEIPQDLLRPYSVWLDAPDAYGPVFLLIKCLPAFFFRGSLLGMVWTMKLIGCVFMAMGGFFFDGILKKAGSPNRARLWTMFVFSPLLLVMTLVDGLNDVFLTALLLGAVYFLLSGKYLLSYFLWAMAFLVKYTAVLVLPLLVIYSFKACAGEGKNGCAVLLKAFLLVAALIALFFAPFWAGPQTFGTLAGLGQRFYSNTFPYLFNELLSRAGLRPGENIVRMGFLGLYLSVYLWLVLRMMAMKEVSCRALFRSLALANLVFYLCLSSPFSYNYLLWALPWLVLSEWPADASLVTLYSFMGLFAFYKRVNFLFVIFAAVYIVILLVRRFQSRPTAHP